MIKHSSSLEKIAKDVSKILTDEPISGYEKWNSSKKVYMSGNEIVYDNGSLKDYIESNSRASIIIKQIKDRGLISDLTGYLDPVAITVNADGGFMGSWMKVRITNLSLLKMIAMQSSSKYGPESSTNITVMSGLQEFELWFYWGSKGKANATIKNIENLL